MAKRVGIFGHEYDDQSWTARAGRLSGRFAVWAVTAVVVCVSAWGLLLMLSDYQAYRDMRRSELERCFHHADYGEPPCDVVQNNTRF